MTIEEEQQDWRDLGLVIRRAKRAGPERVTLDELLEYFGYTREYLRSLPAYSDDPSGNGGIGIQQQP